MKTFDYKNSDPPDIGQLKCRGCGHLIHEDEKKFYIDQCTCELCGGQMMGPMWLGWKESEIRRGFYEYVSSHMERTRYLSDEARAPLLKNKGCKKTCR